MAWQGIGLLQEGLSHSPSNAQFKLLLLLLYCHLGAFEPVVDLYSSLDAKHVQHDTIGSVRACTHTHTHTQQKYTLGIRSMLLVSAFYVFYFTFLFCEK